MRSERKKGRAFLARFMVLMMIINLLSGINPGVVRAAENNNYNNHPAVRGTGENEGIIIKKEVTRYNNNDDTYDIKLYVEGADKITHQNKKTDIVLVMDTSGSMQEPKVNDQYTNIRLDKAKEAATSFVKTLIPTSGKGNIRIGLVTFAWKAEKKSDLTNDTGKLNNAIVSLKAKGGTYTQAGLELAADILKGSNSDEKIIALISDGRPTVANGKHPNFGQRGENGYYRIKKPESRDGYETWHGETNGITGKWIGKGYYAGKKYGNYLVKLINGQFGNGTDEHFGEGAKSWPYNLMGEYFLNATVGAAEKIKSNKVKIYSIGIGLAPDSGDSEKDKADKKLGEDVLKGISFDNTYLDAGSQAEGLKKILDSLAVEIHHAKIVNGTITDPMSDYVDYVDNQVVTLSGEKDGVTAAFSNNTLKVSNINLGKDDQLEVEYQVRLKGNWKDGDFHPTNGKTTLLPIPDGTEMEFKVPEIRADKETTSITVNKTWIGPAPSDRDNIEFIVFADNQPTNYKIKVTPTSTPQKWTGTIPELPVYQNGKSINYSVKETEIDGYESKIKSTAGTNGNNKVFECVNKNTAKISFTVSKEWANTPDDLKFDVNVQLYANDTKLNGVETIHKNSPDSNVVFSNLPKYDDYGKEIKYSAKELRNDGTAIEDKGSLTNDKFNFIVTYNTHNGDNGISILNTCLNPEKATFDVELTKTWEDGVGNEAEFVFTNSKDANNPITKTLNKTEDNFGEDSIWRKTVTLPKYNTDGSKAVYTVTEKEVPGFSSIVSAGQVDFENPSVNATNKRNTKNITVTKVWKNTPKDLETDITVDLYKNGDKSDNSQKIVNGEYQTTFENLPETDENGNPITYTFRENGENDNKITLSNGEEFAVGYDDTTHTITNTYKNLQFKMITVTLIKEWAGDKGKGATFNIKNVNDPNGAGIDVKVTAPTWRVEKELRKYNDDGTLAKYKVTEHNIIGFASDKPDGEGITKDGQEIIFTNTQIKKNLTIKKEWVGTPTNAAFTLTYIYNGGDKSEDLTIPSGASKVTKELPVHDLNGDVINYTVTEKEIEGYQAEKQTKTFIPVPRIPTQ